MFFSGKFIVYIEISSVLLLIFRQLNEETTENGHMKSLVIGCNLVDGDGRHRRGLF